jgi:hypothetical protein
MSTSTAWNATTVYKPGNTVSEDGAVYMAYWQTEGSDPATNNGGSGSGYPWFIVTTDPALPVPSIPTGLSAAGVSNTSVVLKWDPSCVDGGLNPPLSGAGCLPGRFRQRWPLAGRGASNKLAMLS